MPVKEDMPAGAESNEVVAGFARRVALRDVPPEPEPLRFDALSVQQRIHAAFRRKKPALTTPRRTALVQICYRFLTEPVLDSTAHPGASRTRSRDWQLLVALRFVQREHVGRQRRYRLSRAGEDWLLAAVQGTPDAA